MTQQNIDLGTAPDGKDGDASRAAFNKTNQNFTEIYNLVSNAQATATAAMPRSGGAFGGAILAPEIKLGSPPTLLGTQGANFGWNDDLSGGVQFNCNQGLGAGGFAFRTVNSNNTAVVGMFQFNNVGRYINPPISSLEPGQDNTHNLGGGSYRWKSVFATNGLIQSSDARAKTDVETTTLGLAFVLSLRPVSYRMLEASNKVEVVKVGEQTETVTYEDGTSREITYAVTEERVTPIAGTRAHQGLIAQEVAAALRHNGVDPASCGVWTQADPSDADSRQALRYEELIAPLIMAMQEQQTLIAALTDRVAALEAAGSS